MFWETDSVGGFIETSYAHDTDQPVYYRIYITNLSESDADTSAQWRNCV